MKETTMQARVDFERKLVAESDEILTTLRAMIVLIQRKEPIQSNDMFKLLADFSFLAGQLQGMLLSDERDLKNDDRLLQKT